LAFFTNIYLIFLAMNWSVAMKISNKSLISLLILNLFLGLTGCQKATNDKPIIGIVVPLEHKAMTEIVAGFSQTLEQTLGDKYKIKIMNAENDANLQRAIIQQMRDQHYAMIVPIGTSTSQMTLALVTAPLPVVSLAADLPAQVRLTGAKCHTALVHDEIAPAKLIQFIHAVYPHLTKIMLIHSASDKIFPDVAASIAAGKKVGVNIQHLMVNTLPDLTAATAAIPRDIQAVFVLKDSLIVSGIGTLVKFAATRHIPLITADQGSVQEGAGFALGVHEREIGVEGAKLATQILNGAPICQLPIAKMSNLTVFINPQSLKAEGQTITEITAAAKNANLPVEAVQP
jgi:putative ABC transport system substrate-binding protein